MGKKLCCFTVLSLFFFLSFVTIEMQGKARFCTVVEMSEADNMHTETEYWTVSLPYFFFTCDYIAPLSLAVAESAETLNAKCCSATEKMSGHPDNVRSVLRGTSCFSVPPYCFHTDRDYYVFALRRIVV